MQDQSTTKTLRDTEQKMKMVEFFDKIINKVDIDAESILLRVNKNSNIEQPAIEQELNQSRKLVIDQINDIKSINLDNIKNTTSLPEHQFGDLFVKYCVYLDSDTVRSFTFNKDRLGILLVTDFYMSDSQAELLNKMVSSVLKIDLVDKEDKKKILVDNCYMENLVILTELKSKLFNDQFSMTFSKKFFEEIYELKLGIEFNHIKIKSLKDILSRFSSLKTLELRYAIISDLDDLDFHILENLKLDQCVIMIDEEYCLAKGFQSLRVLSLQLLRYKILQFPSVNYLPFLEKLDLSGNTLKDLSDNSFSELSNLKTLDLSKNSIKFIKKATLNGLHNLENFYLNNNEFKPVLQMNAFEGLDNLENLEIGWLDNSTGFENFMNRERVNPQAEYTLNLSNWTNSVKNLKRLSISSSSQKSFMVGREKINESSFINGHKLEELMLSYLDLDIHEFPSNLNMLKRIKLKEVKFTRDTQNLFSNLKQIENVEISFCKSPYNLNIHKLLEDWKNLTKLKFNWEKKIAYTNPNYHQNEFDYDNSLLPINSIGNGFEAFNLNNKPYLIELDLSHNGIKYSSNEFNGLVNLKHLDLLGNELTPIAESAFSSDLKNLIELNLSNNQLEIITNEMLSNLVNLEKLNLKSNKINKIEINSFKNLSKLKYLNLGSNQLQELDNDLFKDLIDLTEICLCNNHIINIDNLFSHNLKLSSLSLETNQIRSVNFRLLAKLVNLECLGLSFNHIEHIAIDEANYLMCCCVKNLRINLDGNKIVSGSKNLLSTIKIISFK